MRLVGCDYPGTAGNVTELPCLSSPDGQGHRLGRPVYAEPELFTELAQDGGAEGDVDDLELIRHEDALPGEEGEAGAQSGNGRHQVKEGIDGSFVEQDRLQQREKWKHVRNLPFLQKVDLLSSQTINICKRQLCAAAWQNPKKIQQDKFRLWASSCKGEVFHKSGTTLGLLFSLVCQFLNLLNQQCQERMKLRCRAALPVQEFLFTNSHSYCLRFYCCVDKKKKS